MLKKKPTYEELEKRVRELERAEIVRKQTEKAMRESERKLQAWIENSPVCTKIVDLDFNLQFMSTSGIRELKIDDINELYGKPYPFHFYPDSFKIPMTSNLKKARETGKIITQEASVLDIDGNKLWYHSTIVPVQDDQGKLDYIMVVSLETTGRKRAAEALRESEEHLDSVLKNIPDIIYRLDQEGNISFINDTIKDYGYTPEELIGRSIFEIVHPEDRKKAIYRVNERRTGERKTKSFEIRLFLREGAAADLDDESRRLVREPVFLLDSEGLYQTGEDQAASLSGTQGIARDITERKQMGQAISTIMESAAKGTGKELFDQLVKSICDWSGANCAIVGELVDDSTVNVLSMYLDGEFKYGYSYDLEGTPCENAAQKGYCVFPEEVQKMFPKDLDLVQMGAESYAGTPLRNDDGETIGILCAISREKLEVPLRMKDVMTILAARASAEIMRSRSDKALRESEARLKAIYENVAIGIAVADNKGRYIQVNKHYLEMFGYGSEEEISVQTVGQLTHPDDRDKTRQAQQDLADGKIDSIRVDKRYLRKDGNYFWGDVTVTPLKLNEGKIKVFVAMIVDITERKLAEEALRESEERFRSIVENTEAGYFFIDSDGIIREVNEAWVKMYKYSSADEIIGHHFTKIQRIDDIGPAKDTFAGIMRGESTYLSGEFSRKCKDGSAGFQTFTARPVIHSGEVRGIEGFIIDITERKRAENELQRSKALLRTVIDTVPNYICAKDFNGRFLLVNKGLAAFYGTTVDEMTGILHADICEDEEELKAMLAADREVLESGKLKIIPEESMQNPDGSVTYLETTKVPFAIFGDPAVLIMARDVTERKELEEERAKAAKLESIGLLAGGIAHDFNNILSIILGNLTFAKMTVNEERSPVAESLTAAEAACGRARDLTQQLLTFAKGGAPVKEKIILSGLIKEATKFSLRGSNVMCRHYIAKDLWFCEVDEGQISQVINNLIINADQAMPNGGTINIRAENDTIGKVNRLPLNDGRYVKITIKDQGHGIPEDQISKIFDPYFTTKQKGSGLGLTTTYSIIKRHGGHIFVESELKVGTKFHIFIPALWEKEEEKEEEKKEIAATRGKILVMDDEQALCDVISMVLKQMGHEVECANNGIQALKMYKQSKDSGQPFDAVILDLTIPGGMGGQETIKRLLKMDPEVKAIVSSGYSNDPVLANFKEYGFSSKVSKPYRLDELREVLQSVIKGKNG